jgi:Ca2+/Na+ antiporter
VSILFLLFIIFIFISFLSITIIIIIITFYSVYLFFYFLLSKIQKSEKILFSDTSESQTKPHATDLTRQLSSTVFFPKIGESKPATSRTQLCLITKKSKKSVTRNNTEHASAHSICLLPQFGK